ncbi:MAG: protein serine/threonine phosphatase [Bacteroidetes bacterium]|jgi:serine phosphatase RsbU (regulator of sigma subunit)|nr:protein serine/threonine phosphatase [Bacteroidota bacterium]
MVSGPFKKYLLPACFFCFLYAAKAQNMRIIDSLNKVLKASKHDTVSIKALNAIAKQYWSSDPEASMKLLEQSQDLADKQTDKKFICSVLLYKAYTFSVFDQFDSSLANYNRGIDLAERYKQPKTKGQLLSGAGNVYNILGDYEKAIPYYLEALKVQESENEQNGLGKTYNSLGVLFDLMGEEEKALEYHFRGLKIKEEQKDSSAIGMSLNNIGNVYGSLKKMDSALYYHQKALDIRTRINDANGMGLSYNNIGNTLSRLERHKEALAIHLKALELFEEAGDKLNIARSSFNIGNQYMVMDENDNAYLYIVRAEKLADELEIKELQKDIYGLLSNYYENKADYKNAFVYSRKFQQVKDSLYNEAKNKEIQSLNTRYETEKKEQENKELQLENDLSAKTIKQQRTVTYFIITGLGLVSILAFFIFRGLKQQRKANEIISRQKTEVEHQKELIESQKELVEEKNKEITDSINYAKRIQTALLPSVETFSEILPNSFVLFKPKDIVSGDFFWITQRDRYVFYVAADCTGHGVPGAFMSMLGTSFLNEIINDKDIIDPCDILDLLKIKIIKSLKQKGEVGGSKDGMDMVLCRLDTSTNELVFAAANNPLWLLRNGEIKEYKADKQPVGIGSEGFDHFNQHVIQLEKGDAVYIFSDGFADQFGGPKGKKFKYKQLEEILISSSGKSLEIQKQQLDQHFESWRGMLEQVDDVCIIGIRI